MPFEKKSIENEQQTNDYVVTPVKMTIPKISKKKHDSILQSNRLAR